VSEAPYIRFRPGIVFGLLSSTVILASTGAGCSLDTRGLTGAGGTGGTGGETPTAGTGGIVATGVGGTSALGGAPGSLMGDGGVAGSGAAGTSGGGAGSFVSGSGGGTGLGGSGGSGATVVGTGGGGGTVAGTGGAGGTAGGMGGAGGTVAGMSGADGGLGGVGGAPFDAGAGGAPASNAGCADGTREAFVDNRRFPSVAGCSGGWTVPGVLTPASMMASCNRAAGNSGLNPSGTGCTVEDLCADGWHVCLGANELTTLGSTCQDAGIVTGVGAPQLFFVTRQRGRAPTACMPNDTTGTNNLHGCGNFGTSEDMNCMPPLDRQLTQNQCASRMPWSCTDPNNMSNEGSVVVKPGSAAGGVLCCR
jgi:hypothetical protein